MSSAGGDFRFMRVVSTQRIGPRFQRMRLTGDDIAHFQTCENLHLRLYIPKRSSGFLPGSDISPPGEQLSRENLPDYAMRYFTIRNIDADAGWLDIDFLLHARPGPACNFAIHARPGDVCGVSGPCGRSVKPARYYLLSGDETALPAMARIAEALPGDATGRMLILSEAPADNLDLAVPPGISVETFFRQGDCMPHRFVEASARAIRQTAAAPDDHFVWLANEFGVYMTLRRRIAAIANLRAINVPYWRAGEEEEGSEGLP